MTASAHLATGAVCGLTVQKYLPENYGLFERVAVGFVAGVLSHVLTDAIPHEEYGFKGYKLGAVLLFEISAVLLLVLSSPSSATMKLVIFSAMAGAAFPDLLTMSYDFTKWGWIRILDDFFHTFHGKIPLGFQVSLWYQVIIALASIIFVKLKST